MFVHTQIVCPHGLTQTEINMEDLGIHYYPPCALCEDPESMQMYEFVHKSQKNDK